MIQTAQRIRMHRTGGPDVLTLETVPLAPPGPGEAQVRTSAAGVNFIDVYKRTGLYPVETPFTPGEEGAGVVEAVGPGVAEVNPGDRVAWLQGGAYASALNLPAARLARLLDTVDAETAASVFLKGLTADMLLNGIAGVRAGQSVLIHAAAGGVGHILTQWAKHLGATVIGTAGNAAKADLARAHGADHVILYREADTAKAVRALTGGRGVDAVFDGVGQATFRASLDGLAPRGWMISYGNASGPVEPFAPLELAARGSLRFSRPVLFHYVSDKGEYAAAAERLFAVLQSGAVRPVTGGRYALSDAARAHSDLESRQTQGSVVLIP